MKKINLRKVLSLALSLLMVFSLFACIPVSAADTQSLVTVLQDGSSVGWYSGAYYNVATGVTDVKEGKSLVAVYPMQSGDHMIDTASASLTAAGITDTSSINTLSMYIKNTANTELKFYIGHNNWQHALGTGTYYLVPSDNSDVIKASTWEIAIPAGFDGYIIFDAKSCAYWNDYVAHLSGGSLIFWTTNNADLYGNPWYYSEIAVSTAIPAEVAAYYVDGASLEAKNFVLQNNSGAPNWCWGGSASATTLNGKSVLSVTGNGAWVDFSRTAGSLTAAGISKDNVNAISLYVNNPAENGTGFVGLWCYADAPWHRNPLSYINVTLYDINTKNVTKLYTTDGLGSVSIPAGFDGYVIYDVETARAAGNLGAFFDCDLAHPVIYSGNGTVYYADYTLWTISYKNVLDGILPKITNIAIQNNSGAPNWCWGGSASATTVNGKNVLSVTGNGAWVDFSRTAGSLTAAGISKDDVTAISLYVNNPAENGTGFVGLWCYADDPWHRNPLSYINVTLYDVNSEDVTKIYTVDGLGSVSIPAGFEGYVIYDVETARATGNLGAFFDCDLAHPVIYSGNGTLYYADYSVWTASYNNVLKEFGAVTNNVVIQNNSGAPTWYWGGSASATNVNGKDVLSVTGNSAWVDFSRNVANLTVGEISKDNVNAISIYVNNPAENGDGYTGIWDYADTPYHRNPLTNVTATLYDINKKTTVNVTVNGVLGETTIPAGFEGYVIYDVEATRKAGALGAFFDCDLAHPVIYNGNGTVYYADYTVWTKDSATVTKKVSGGNASTTVGDVNGDNNVDITDLVRFKKYFAGTALINTANANVNGKDGIDSLDLAALVKVLLGVTDEEQPETESNEIGMSIFHLGYGEWDKSYATTYGEESTFLNYYTTTSIYTLAKLIEEKNQAWYQLDGYSIFKDEANPTVISEDWKNAVSTKMNAFKKYGVDSAVAGFLTEEWDAILTDEQIEEVYNYLNETYPEMRIFAVLTVNSVNGTKSLSPDAYAKVTDIAYDYYGSTDIDLHRTYTNTMKQAVSSDTRIWFFPLSSNLQWRHTPEFVSAHIEMCYTLLNEQENKGGLFFYNWLTFEDAEHIGLDNLVSTDASYGVVYERIVEIGNEILG